jgi:predicted nuclease with TOPRIM domain
MKKLLFAITLLSRTAVFASAQSKKDQIEGLTRIVDSLEQTIQVLVSESVDQQLNLGAEIKLLESQLGECSQEKAALKQKLASEQSMSNQQKSDNEKLRKEIVALNDSLKRYQLTITELHQKPITMVSSAYEIIRKKWGYFLELFEGSIDLQNISQNQVVEFCDDDRCVKFLITEKYLIASYRVHEVSDLETIIIRLSDGKNLVKENEGNFFITQYNDLQKILTLEGEGFDDNGHYFRSGIFDLNSEVLNLDSKKY